MKPLCPLPSLSPISSRYRTSPTDRDTFPTEMEWSKRMGKLGPNSWAEEKRMLGLVIPEMQRENAKGRVRRVDPYSSSLITRGHLWKRQRREGAQKER